MKWPWLSRRAGAAIRTRVQDLSDEIARLTAEAATRDHDLRQQVEGLADRLAANDGMIADQRDALRLLDATMARIEDEAGLWGSDREQLAEMIVRLKRIELQSHADADDARRALLALAERLEAVRRHEDPSARAASA